MRAGAELFVEAKERCPLLATMIPGSEVEMQLDFTLPQGVSLDNWELDIVAEGAFWFSSKGIHSCAVPVLLTQ